MGVFGNRLSEQSEFPIDAHHGEQRRKQAVGGSLFFGNFLLAKQKKVTRQSRESDYFQDNMHNKCETLSLLPNYHQQLKLLSYPLTNIGSVDLNMDRNTVFVIGAGASKEANLPTGYELKSKIAELLDMRFDYQQISGDSIIADALRIFVRDKSSQSGDINPYLYEAWHIRDALPQAISIDNFIDTHRENPKIATCGKLAIVRSILDAERKSLLYFEKHRINLRLYFKNLENTWYGSFFQLLTENCAKSDLKARFQSITLIIFNYDRCVEHFLLHALQNYYKINETEAAEIVKFLNIYHPYGDVGYLPWLQSKGAMAFGESPNSLQLLELASKIKTFTEGTDPNSSKIVEIKTLMAKASHLIFMGFAFHKLNMQLISPLPDIKQANTVRCFATTHQLSDDSKETIAEKIQGLYAGEVKVRMSNLQCNAFFNEFWRSLAF